MKGCARTEDKKTSWLLSKQKRSQMPKQKKKSMLYHEFFYR